MGNGGLWIFGYLWIFSLIFFDIFFGYFGYFLGKRRQRVWSFEQIWGMGDCGYGRPWVSPYSYFIARVHFPFTTLSTFNMSYFLFSSYFWHFDKATAQTVLYPQCIGYKWEYLFVSAIFKTFRIQFNSHSANVQNIIVWFFEMCSYWSAVCCAMSSMGSTTIVSVCIQQKYVQCAQTMWKKDVHRRERCLAWMWSVQCATCAVQVCTMQHKVQWAVYSVQCAVLPALYKCAPCSVRCNEQCVVCSVQCYLHCTSVH